MYLFPRGLVVKFTSIAVSFFLQAVMFGSHRLPESRENHMDGVANCPSLKSSEGPDENESKFLGIHASKRYGLCCTVYFLFIIAPRTSGYLLPKTVGGPVTALPKIVFPGLAVVGSTDRLLQLLFSASILT